jgi:hypothetical protein
VRASCGFEQGVDAILQEPPVPGSDVHIAITMGSRPWLSKGAASRLRTRAVLYVQSAILNHKHFA